MDDDGGGGWLQAFGNVVEKKVSGLQRALPFADLFLTSDY